MIRKYKTALPALTLASMLLSPTYMLARQDKQPDNTAANKHSKSPTADQAKNDTSDREIMKNIRREVMKDKSLSTYGHNVKIVAVHGNVTLSGPVHSEDEKKAIEEHARKYAGDGKLDNQITVKSDQK